MRRDLISTVALSLLLLCGCSDDDGPTGPADNPYRGDINFNGTSYEIADVVMYADYFTEGLEVFTVNSSNQIAATDLNADGLALSLADFVYGVRIVIGDANPVPESVPPTSPVQAQYVVRNGRSIDVLDDMQCGALYVVVQGEITPELRDADMTMRFRYDGSNTHILIYSLGGHSCSGSIVDVNGNILSLEAATAEGAPLELSEPIRREFYLYQYYPNPFSPVTHIEFDLVHAANYKLTIFDTNGNTVEEFIAFGEAGKHLIELDLDLYVSGVYFYRLQVGDLTVTRKMVLLK